MGAPVFDEVVEQEVATATETTVLEAFSNALSGRTDTRYWSMSQNELGWIGLEDTATLAEQTNKELAERGISGIRFSAAHDGKSVVMESPNADFNTLMATNTPAPVVETPAVNWTASTTLAYTYQTTSPAEMAQEAPAVEASAPQAPTALTDTEQERVNAPERNFTQNTPQTQAPQIGQEAIESLADFGKKLAEGKSGEFIRNNPSNQEMIDLAAFFAASGSQAALTWNGKQVFVDTSKLTEAGKAQMQAVADEHPNLAVGNELTATQTMVGAFFSQKEPGIQPFENVTPEDHANLTAFLKKHNAEPALLIPQPEIGKGTPSNIQIDFSVLARNPEAVKEMEQIGRQMGVTEPQISFSQKMWKAFEKLGEKVSKTFETIDMQLGKALDFFPKKFQELDNWLTKMDNQLDAWIDQQVKAVKNAPANAADYLANKTIVGRYVTDADTKEKLAELGGQNAALKTELEAIKAQLAAVTGEGASTPSAANLTQEPNVDSPAPVVESQLNFRQPVELAHSSVSETVTQDPTPSGLILDGSGRIKEGELQNVIDFEKLGMQYQGENTTNNIQLTATSKSALNNAISNIRQ